MPSKRNKLVTKLGAGAVLKKKKTDPIATGQIRHCHIIGDYYTVIGCVGGHWKIQWIYSIDSEATDFIFQDSELEADRLLSSLEIELL